MSIRRYLILGLALVSLLSCASKKDDQEFITEFDTGDLLDGDLRPQIDPRNLFTACLDWLGGDVERILGRRYDDIRLIP